MRGRIGLCLLAIGAMVGLFLISCEVHAGYSKSYSGDCSVSAVFDPCSSTVLPANAESNANPLGKPVNCAIRECTLGEDQCGIYQELYQYREQESFGKVSISTLNLNSYAHLFKHRGCKHRHCQKRLCAIIPGFGSASFT